MRQRCSFIIYKEVQNKLLFAVSGKTAAELVYYRANASLPMMGLTSTERSEKVCKKDVGIGKNYLSEQELQALKLIVEQYLAFAESQALAQRPMYMKDWIKRLDLILTMNEYTILDHAGVRCLMRLPSSMRSWSTRSFTSKSARQSISRVFVSWIVTSKP